MRQRIICGIDDSDRTYEAVAVAWDLSRRLELPLMLTHVAPQPEGFPFGEPDEMQRDRQQREARGAALLRDVAMTFDLPPETALYTDSGEPASTLRTIAEEEDAAMLVVASRGRGRIRSALFGSVTAELVDGLRRPLMLIPPGAGTRYRTATRTDDATVVCGIDGSSQAEYLLPVADRLAAALRARLLLIHADVHPMTTPHGTHAVGAVGMAGAPVVLGEQSDELRQSALDQLQRARDLATETPRVDVRAESGDLATTMAALAGQPSVQVLAVAQDSPWQRLAARVGCPVLVVPQEEMRGLPA